MFDINKVNNNNIPITLPGTDKLRKSFSHVPIILKRYKTPICNTIKIKRFNLSPLLLVICILYIKNIYINMFLIYLNLFINWIFFMCYNFMLTEIISHYTIYCCDNDSKYHWSIKPCTNANTNRTNKKDHSC